MLIIGFQNVTVQKELILIYTDVIAVLSDVFRTWRIWPSLPDLAFSYSQLIKFVQYPGMVHSEAAERVLQYVRATCDQGISYYDFGPQKKELIGRMGV